MVMQILVRKWSALAFVAFLFCATSCVEEDCYECRATNYQGREVFFDDVCSGNSSDRQNIERKCETNARKYEGVCNCMEVINEAHDPDC